MSYIEYLIGIIKKLFRKEIFSRTIRLLKYKIFGLKDLRLCWFKRNEIFLVYTMGKVGSASIYETLKSVLAYNNIYHVHFLTEKNIQWRTKFKNNPSVSIVEKYVRKKLQKTTKKRLKVITIVRDITIRDLSMIFQNIKSFFPADEKKKKYTINEIESIHEKLNQDLSLNWFENEFNQFFGIDIYDYSFDKTKGYSIYNMTDKDILVIKLEKLNNCYQEALKEFTGINFKKLIRINETSGKKNSQFYNHVKQNITISDKKLEMNYNSIFMKHFYSTEEIECFLNRWKNIRKQNKTMKKINSDRIIN